MKTLDEQIKWLENNIYKLKYGDWGKISYDDFLNNKQTLQAYETILDSLIMLKKVRK